MTTLRDRPSFRLTQHFFRGLFDLGVLSEAGTASFTRMIIGICAVFLSAGLLLARMFLSKYGSLAAEATPVPYLQAVLADHALLIGLPMWIVAVVTVLIGHALFPDETDFRVLMALPVTRRLVFTTKLVALALFAGLFVIAAHVALVPLFLVTCFSRWPGEAFLWRVAAYEMSSLLASGFVLLAVTAVHGALLIGAPRGRVLGTSAMFRSVLLCALVLSLPLLAQLPAQASDIANGAPWLYLAPPVWFVGLERWFLGDQRVHFLQLAGIAGLAVCAASALAVGSYAVVYRRFEHVMLRSGQTGERPAWLFTRKQSAARPLSRPMFAAVRTFIGITFRRSVLHQGILVVLSAAGAGLVVNTLIGADIAAWWSGGGVPSVALIESVMWAPFALILVVSLAARTALVVPIDQRANWVFRITEQDVGRPDQLQAAAQSIQWLGVVIPVFVMLPIQLVMLGSSAWVVVPVELVCGWLLVETLMRQWRLIPFTCSYIPGKGFVPQTILIACTWFLVFTSAGAGLSGMTTEAMPIAFVLNGMFFVTAFALRRRRLRTAQTTPLMFEDQVPTDVQTLGLFSD